MLIFTDLDGTLLNQDDYRFEAAIPALNYLQKQRIPVIPVTSKTRCEVEVLRQQIAPNDPFIVENGSGIFVATPDDRFSLVGGEPWESFQLLRLGCTYVEARQSLQKMSAHLGKDLRGFGDLSVAEIAALTGLSTEESIAAKAREFTEPFITPKTVPPEDIEDAAKAIGFYVTVGDRFSHLIGMGAGKGKAVQQLVRAYQAAHPSTQITTIGLGNSPNDREMLDAVDIPIIIPGKNGPHPGLMGYGWQVAPFPGARGWAAAIEKLGIAEGVE